MSLTLYVNLLRENRGMAKYIYETLIRAVYSESPRPKLIEGEKVQLLQGLTENYLHDSGQAGKPLGFALGREDARIAKKALERC